MAEKINGDKWMQHLDIIAELYVENGWETADIAEYLRVKCEFPTSKHTVKKYLGEWKIRRFSREQEHEILARQLLRCRQAGKNVSFLRFGKPYSSEKVEEYLTRFPHPHTQPSGEEMPRHLRIIESTAPHGEQHEIRADGNHGAPFQAGRESSSFSQQDPDRTQRKRRRADMPETVRPNQHTRSPPAKDTGANKRAGATEGADDSGKEDSEDETADTKTPSLESIQKAIENMKITLSRDLGLSDADMTEAVLRPKKFKRLVESSRERVQHKEKRTDLGPLHFAANRNNSTIINILLKKGTEINARGGKGWTALHLAANGGHLEALGALLSHDDIDVNAVDDDGDTPLIHAIAFGTTACALLLIHKGADVDKEDTNGQTALHRACRRNNMATVVAAILEKTKKVNSQDCVKRTPLHWAASADGSEEYVKMLINADADLNIQDEDGRTPMHQACFDCSVNLLMVMVQDNNVDLTIAGHRGETVLHLLCQREDLCSVVEVVVAKAGVDINARRTDNCTPLILAALNGSYDTVATLLRHKADVSIHDKDLDTALTVAIKRDDNKMAELLINNDSPVNPQYKSPARYEEELERQRMAQQVSTVLNSMNQGPQPSAARSYVAPVVGRLHPEQGRSPTMPPPGMSNLNALHLHAMMGQTVDFNRANGVEGGMLGYGPGTLVAESVQPAWDTNMMFNYPTELNSQSSANVPFPFTFAQNNMLYRPGSQL